MNVLGELLSGFLGALLGCFFSFLTLRYNYKDLYARTVSENRMEWINNFREEIATVAAAVKCGNSLEIRNGDRPLLYEAEKARVRLLTRINMDTSKSGNEYNKVLSDILSDIDFTKQCKEDKARIDALLDLSRKILEIEWKRVKNEAGGKEK
ncbi:MAG: hypothetical protein GX638_19175 [Crenarchaeota archaeon]|nr:hypothetical protein [Thermoproteota archaeon]